MNDRSPVRRPPRRTVLAAAALTGLLAALALGPADESRDRSAWEPALVADAVAQPAPPAPPKPVPEAPKEPAATEDAAKAEPPAASGERSVDAEITIDGRGVTVRKGARKQVEKTVVVGDHEFDSFEEFVHQAPWLAGLVFMVTALVFVVPLLVIILVVWYKMRRTRMMNETMLKLAERGVVPPAQALASVAEGRAAETLREVPPAAPLYDQAKAIRKREAWSDLRKGVLIGGVGLGLTFWSMLDDGSANGFGLILLFVGIGYTILWYFEDRRIGDGRDRSPPTTGGV